MVLGGAFGDGWLISISASDEKDQENQMKDFEENIGCQFSQLWPSAECMANPTALTSTGPAKGVGERQLAKPPVNLGRYCMRSGNAVVVFAEIRCDCCIGVSLFAYNKMK